MSMPRSAIFGLAVSLLLTIFFIAWSLQVLQGDALPGFDRAVATTFRDVSQGDHFREIMVLITLMGGVPAMFVLAFVGSTWQWRRGDALLATAWVVLALVGGLLDLGLKVSLDRTRPPIEWRDAAASETTPSFPSGHSMGSAIGYGMLGFVALQSSRRRRTKIAVLILVAAGVSLIGFSRIYLRAHWFSDVIGGFALGAAWLSFGLACVAWLRTRRVQILQPIRDALDGLNAESTATAPPLNAQLDPVTSTP
jgi:membrane-associated phospholipid phosphatase